MLVNGDLIRVPQGTVLLGVDTGTVLPLRVASDPAMAIVIQNNTSTDDLIKILMDDEIVFVDKRVVRLVEG